MDKTSLSSWSNFFVQFFNECTLLIATWFLLNFTGFVPSPESRYGLAWGLLAMVLVCIAVNLCAMLLFLAYRAFKVVRARLRRAKARRVA